MMKAIDGNVSDIGDAVGSAKDNAIQLRRIAYALEQIALKNLTMSAPVYGRGELVTCRFCNCALMVAGKPCPVCRKEAP